MPKENAASPQISTVGSLELTEEIIRMHAYQLFLQRGCEHGHDVEDWLQAEAEILGKKSAGRTEPRTAQKQVVAA